jgi:hypothetical protein
MYVMFTYKMLCKSTQLKMSVRSNIPRSSNEFTRHKLPLDVNSFVRKKKKKNTNKRETNYFPYSKLIDAYCYYKQQQRQRSIDHEELLPSNNSYTVAVRTLTNVVFPAPFGPTNAILESKSTPKLTLSYNGSHPG